MVVLLYSLTKGSYNMLGKIFNRDRSLIYRWIREAGLSFDPPMFMEILKKSNLTKCGILSTQKNELWIIKAVNRSTRKTIECPLRQTKSVRLVWMAVCGFLAVVILQQSNALRQNKTYSSLYLLHRQLGRLC